MWFWNISKKQNEAASIVPIKLLKLCMHLSPSNFTEWRSRRCLRWGRDDAACSSKVNGACSINWTCISAILNLHLTMEILSIICNTYEPRSTKVQITGTNILLVVAISPYPSILFTIFPFVFFFALQNYNNLLRISCIYKIIYIIHVFRDTLKKQSRQVLSGKNSRTKIEYGPSVYLERQTQKEAEV